MLNYLCQQLLNGVQLGAIYALIALGYSMVYGIIKLINFAHADIFMVGAYIAFFLASFFAGAGTSVPLFLWVWIALMVAYLILDFLRRTSVTVRRIYGLFTQKRIGQSALSAVGTKMTGSILYICALSLVTAVLAVLFYFFATTTLPLLPVPVRLPVLCVLVMTICGCCGMAMEKIAYRPLRDKPRLLALITALGVSLFLENFCSQDIVFGNKYRAFPELIKQQIVFHPAGLSLNVTTMLLVNVCVLAITLLALWFLVEKTLLGKQMRAVACNMRAASLMGININRIIAVTFCIGPALAGLAGILYAINYGILQSPFLGFTPGIKAFIAAVLGGIGSLPGAVIGALIMGITEVFANSVDSNLGFAIAFVVLIIILLIKPSGILGKKETEKV